MANPRYGKPWGFALFGALGLAILVAPQLWLNPSDLVTVEYVGEWTATYAAPRDSAAYGLAATIDDGRQVQAWCRARPATSHVFDCSYRGPMSGWVALWGQQQASPGLELTSGGGVAPDVTVNSILPPAWLAAMQIGLLAWLAGATALRPAPGAIAGWAPWVLVPLLVNLVGALILPAAGKYSFLDILREQLQAQPLLTILSVVVLAPVVEELFFREVGWRILRTCSGERTTLVATTTAFTAVHLGQYDPSAIALVFATGLALGVVRLRSGSALPGMLAHALVNATGLLLLSRHAA